MLEKKDEVIRTLINALEFYKNGFHPFPNKRYGGLEYRPTEALLDDCGNIARDAIKLAGAGYD